MFIFDNVDNVLCPYNGLELTLFGNWYCGGEGVLELYMGEGWPRTLELDIGYKPP